MMPTSETTIANGGKTISSLPRLVTFGNIADPESVERVDPRALETSFGVGVKLRQITVQITDDAVTADISKRLTWLTSKAVMTNPGWARMSYEARETIINLFSGTLGDPK